MSDPKQPEDGRDDDARQDKPLSENVQDEAQQDEAQQDDAQQDDAQNPTTPAADEPETDPPTADGSESSEAEPPATEVQSEAAADQDDLMENAAASEFGQGADGSASASGENEDEDASSDEVLIDDQAAAKPPLAQEGAEAGRPADDPLLSITTLTDDDEGSDQSGPSAYEAAVAEDFALEDEPSIAPEDLQATEANKALADQGSNAIASFEIDETSPDTVPVEDVFGAAPEGPAAIAATEPHDDQGSDASAENEEVFTGTVPIEDVLGRPREELAATASAEAGADDGYEPFAMAEGEEASADAVPVAVVSDIAEEDVTETASTDARLGSDAEDLATTETDEIPGAVVPVAVVPDVVAEDRTETAPTPSYAEDSSEASAATDVEETPDDAIPDTVAPDVVAEDRTETAPTPSYADNSSGASAATDVEETSDDAIPDTAVPDVVAEDRTETAPTPSYADDSSEASAATDIGETSAATAPIPDEGEVAASNSTATASETAGVDGGFEAAATDVDEMPDERDAAADAMDIGEEAEANRSQDVSIPLTITTPTVSEPGSGEDATEPLDAHPDATEDALEFSTPRDTIPESAIPDGATPQLTDPPDETPPVETPAIAEDAAASGGADKIAIAIKAAEEAVRPEDETVPAAATEEEAAAWEQAWREAEAANEAEKRAATEERAQRDAAFFSTANAFAPFAIVAYCLALAALRLSFSPFLEVDESEFVGRVDFRLIYDNAHPPLFNWAMRILLNLTAWSWADAVAILRYALLGGFHYLTWVTASRVAGPRAGIAALAVSALCPQIVWMSTHTLAHSIMTLCATAAVLFCTLRALKKPGWKSYAWLGLAMSLGALAKFNFFLLLIPFFAAFAIDREGRRLFTQPLAWVAPAVFVATSAPSLIAAAIYTADSASRIEKLYRPNQYSFLDLPYVGVDGFVSLIVMTLAWAGIAAAVWLGARAYDRRYGVMAEPSAESADRAPYSAVMIGRILERAILMGLALFALLVLAGDVTKVEERYLTPILALLPVYLALRWPLSLSARPVALLAIVAYVAVFPGFWGYVTHGKHRFAIPYDSVAAQIRRQYPESLPLLALRHDDRANMVLALNWPGSETPRYQLLEDRAVLVWRGRGVAPKRLEPEGFGPASPVTTVAAAYRNSTDLEAVYSFQLYVRTGP